MRTAAFAVAAAALVTAAAHAQDKIPRASLIGGETVDAGQDVFSSEIGWPSVSLGYTHGLTPYTDAGVRFDVLYAIEGTTQDRFGLGLRVPLRAIAIRGSVASLLVHFDPGVSVYPKTEARWAALLPIGGAIGFQFSDDFRMALGMDLPISFVVTPSAALDIGTQFGVGFEYLPDPHLLVGLNTRFGPLFSTSGSASQFSFLTQLLLAYRM
jgi:opacity protein-like surface antigen